MTSGKRGSNPPKVLICEGCGERFTKLVYPSQEPRRFCGVACRNKSNTKQRIPRVHTCPVCGKKIDSKAKHCLAHHVNPLYIWTPERIAILRRHYALRGKEGVAEMVGLSEAQVLAKACSLGLNLRPSTYRRKVYGGAASRMRENNPASRPEVQVKLAEWRRNHPEEHAKHMAKLFEGHRRIQKNKPTKLERAFFSYLDLLQVEYEPFYLVKPKFIVDARCGPVIIQADGDYWHGHPRFNSLTERQKAQQRRDHAQDTYLRACGFRVVRIWESEMSLRAVAQALGLDPTIIRKKAMAGSA